MSIFYLFSLSAPMVLGVEESTSVHSGPATTVTIKAGLGETSKLHKALVYNTTLSARKPKRSNGEIPLLIIRPIELKKKKPYKEHMVKIMSGGVASYGNYPEIHTSDHEVFTLEHMLPILGLEGMVFNGIPKHPTFNPSPQYKPSDFHYQPQKYKEETPVLFGFKPTEAEPVQSLPSPSPSSYQVPAVNTEDQLLKIGHQALSKLEIPGSSAQPPYSSVTQEKPSFTKSEQFPTKFNFQHGQSYKAVPIGGGHPGFGPGTFVGMHNEIVKYHNKPQFYPSKPSSYKWSEHPKKPQMASPLSISTNFYYPKTLSGNVEDGHQQQQQPLTYYQHQQQPTAPQVQTHVSFYIPKEIEPLPHPQPVSQQHEAPQQMHQPSLPVNTVQNGEHIEFVVPKQPSHEEPPKTYYKQKFYKQQNGGQQGTYYIHKQFEYSGKPHANENNVVSEYHGSHGSHNHSNVEVQHLPEPLPYSAPQYLPLQQTYQQQQQQQQQPPPALTLHQTHPQPQSFHHPISTSAHQNHWKLGRRNHHHEHVKPVEESDDESEQQDNSHAPSVQSIKTLKPAERATTEVKVEIEHRVDEKQKQQQQKQQQQKQQQQLQQQKQQQQQQQQQPKGTQISESTTIRPTTTRAGRQG
ncbi:ataxin-2 homolog [Ochlerotatus camptorhynchus]|uniref:ataxin-2 homolog n=1 Tax=Ochlerotatus camptorhynchus TaxID=644619 RepID=UPI0031D06F26